MEFENQLKIGIGVYSPSEIAKILRLPYHKVNRWIDKYWDGDLGKEFENRYSWLIDKSKVVSFHTLVEFYVMMELAERGVNTKKVLKAHKLLSNLFNTPFPFALKEVLQGLKTDGAILYLKKGEDTITLDDTKQYNLDFIHLFFKNLEFDAENLASRFWPLGKDKSVVVDPKRKFGHPVINGFNIYPETFYGLFLAGETVDYIAYLYEVEAAHVHDAIEYCKAA